MAHIVDAVVLDLSPAGVPRSVGWQGQLYLATDTPTRLEIVGAAHAALTHPLAAATGWRFQATASSGETLVFDVVRDGKRWVLLDVYR